MWMHAHIKRSLPFVGHVCGHHSTRTKPTRLDASNLHVPATLGITSKEEKGFESSVCLSRREAKVQGVTICRCTQPSHREGAQSLDVGQPLLSSVPRNELSAQHFVSMCDRLGTWKATYFTTVVPGTVVEAKELSEWCSVMRKLHRKRLLPEWAVSKLDELGMEWKVDVVTAKWYSNFHAAKEFKEINGGEDCDINTALPAEYWNEERPDWVEASRWLERQRDLYRRQKLTMARVRLLKDFLGEYTK
jgi:hypothetical protein